MEDKQLDFNAPLLSVRRFSGSSEGKNNKKSENSQGNRPYVPPIYKSDLNSGPMRIPGAIPFLWEQIPGRRKDGEGLKDRSTERPPVTPKLPPGRSSDVKPRFSEKKIEERSVVRPGNDNGMTIRQKVVHTNGVVSESSKEGKKEKRESDSEDEDEDEDEVYADAVETLSRSESFFFNCSVSGISGLNETNDNRQGISAADSQTRGFMMDRFLPAAKAMTSETPQHAAWKQPVVREQPMQMKKVPNGDKRLPPYQYNPYSIQYVHETVEEESEEEDDDFSEVGNPSAKACGLLPKFCLKNSICLLNPIPGMKVRSRTPYPSVRTFNTHGKTTYSESRNDTDDVNNWEAVYKHKLLNGLLPLDDESKVTSESNRLTYWSDSQTPDGSSPRIHSGGGGISPFRSDGTQSPFHEGTGFLGIPKQVNSAKMNQSIQYKDSQCGSGSLSPMVEKTLYVDSENVQTPISNPSSLDTNVIIGSKQKDSDIFPKCPRIEDVPVAESSPDYTNKAIISQEGNGTTKPKMSGITGSSFWSSSNRPTVGRHVNGTEAFRKRDVLGHESRSLMSSDMGTSGNMDLDKTECLRQENRENSNVFSLQLPLPPPLPKSPSESWLWRTLPSVSSKNGAFFHPRNQSSKASSIDPKWETIVKISNVHHGHLRFSEELTTSSLQQSET